MALCYWPGKGVTDSKRLFFFLERKGLQEKPINKGFKWYALRQIEADVYHINTDMRFPGTENHFNGKRCELMTFQTARKPA